jgi:hypothetical protein
MTERRDDYDELPPFFENSETAHIIAMLSCPFCNYGELHQSAVMMFMQELAIKFECESCHRASELTIARHKRNTFVAWRKPILDR